jgi:hypothetical protein
MNPGKRLSLILLAVPILLLIPLVGTLVSPEVQWDVTDFLVMGSLLLIAGLLLELIIRKVSNKPARVLGIVLLLLAVLLIWAEMAVGIFGSPLAGS